MKGAVSTPTVRSSPVAAVGTLIALLAVASLARSRQDVPPSPAPRVTRTEGPVDLNRAGAEDLERLPRIGPALAARIVEHRERHGPFPSVSALDDVPGVGPAVLRALEGHVIVTEPSDGDAGLSLPPVPPPR